jgi:hypothetical protein
MSSLRDHSQGSRMARPDARSLDPWQLVWTQPYIDSDTLAAAIEGDFQEPLAGESGESKARTTGQRRNQVGKRRRKNDDDR